MSDDTPTQKFDVAGDAPTERMTQTTSDSGEAPAGRSRRMVIILASIGGALLLAVLILLVVVLTRGSGDPVALPTDTATESSTPSATPSESASSTPTPTQTETEAAPPPPPPPTAGPTINSFTTANDEVLCNTQAPNPSSQYISFSWSTSDVSEVYFGVNTNDASQGFFFNNLPPSGDTSDFPPGYDPFQYPCPTESTKYTLTVVDSDGLKASKSITITNVGDTP